MASYDSDEDWPDNDDDDEEEAEESFSRVQSVMEPSRSFDTAEEALAYDKSLGLDLLAYMKALDFHARVQLVNFARTHNGSIDELNERLRGEEWRSAPLKPVICDDGLILALDDLDSDDDTADPDLQRKLQQSTAAVRKALESDDFSDLPAVAALLPDIPEESDDVLRTQLRSVALKASDLLQHR